MPRTSDAETTTLLRPDESEPAATSKERAVDVALGQRIRRLRRARNMTQSDLARIIGVTYQQVYKYEYGLDRIAIGRLVVIAAALSVSVVELIDSLPGDVTGDATAQPSTIDAAERMLLIEAYSDIEDDDLRRRLRELIHSLSSVTQPGSRRSSRRRMDAHASPG
jgi:transcriptional regulator with XRE-family HTH domain